MKDFIKSVKENIEVYTNEIMEDTNIRYREDNSESRICIGFIRHLLNNGIHIYNIMAPLLAKKYKDKDSLANDIHTDSDQVLDQVLACEHQKGPRNGQSDVAIGAGQHVRCNLRLSEDNDEDECGDNDRHNTNSSGGIETINDNNDHNNDNDDEVKQLSQSIAHFCDRSNMYLITPLAKCKFLDQIQYLSKTVQNLEEDSSDTISSHDDQNNADNTIQTVVNDTTQHNTSVTMSQHTNSLQQMDVGGYNDNDDAVMQETDDITDESSNNDCGNDDLPREVKNSRKRGFEMMIGNQTYWCTPK